jgi:hypothetical protein
MTFTPSAGSAKARTALWLGIAHSRLWYLFGAMLVAAWLGQGTCFARQTRAAIVLLVILAPDRLCRLSGLHAQLDPSLVTSALQSSSELNGRAIVTPGVRTLTPFFNLYGTLALVGGAGYSAWLFFRKRVLLHRTLGNVMIAVGALMPAFGGTFSRMGIPGALYISELLGVIWCLSVYRATTQSLHRSEPPSRLPVQINPQCF